LTLKELSELYSEREQVAEYLGQQAIQGVAHRIRRYGE
jgi:hypothetical protein